MEKPHQINLSRLDRFVATVGVLALLFTTLATLYVNIAANNDRARAVREIKANQQKILEAIQATTNPKP